MFATLTQNAAERCMSSARMGLYKNFFGAGTDRECMGAMMWQQAASAALWPLLSLVEVVFRNRTHYGLSMLHGGVSTRAWYGGGSNDMRLKVRLQRKIDDLLNLKDASGLTLVNSVDDFISETTFGLWIEALYELHADRRFRFTKMAFPGYSVLADKSAWTAPARSWVPLINRLERHKAYRDIVAHHGPLWKVPFEPMAGATAILPASPGALIQALRKEATALRTTVEEMEPALVDFWDGPPSTSFLQLTTIATLEGYLGRRPIPLAPPASAAP
jgi:hypothetical protein